MRAPKCAHFNIPSIVAGKHGAAYFADMIIDDFEERLQPITDGKLQVMGIAIHPHLVCQPYRMRHLCRALEHITARWGDIWIITAREIYDHVLTLPKGIIPGE